MGNVHPISWIKKMIFKFQDLIGQDREAMIEKLKQRFREEDSKEDIDSKLDKAKGCIIGALCGDAIGAYLEFHRGEITEELCREAVQMLGGGVFKVGPGQVTDDGELTMCLLHALVNGIEMGWMKHAFICCLRYLRLAKDQQEEAKKVKEEEKKEEKEEAKKEEKEETRRKDNKIVKKEARKKAEEALGPTFYENAMVEILMGGGDTDTNACIAGGLIGAIVGFKGLPEEARSKVLSWNNNKKEGHQRTEFLVPRFHAEDLIDKLYYQAQNDPHTPPDPHTTPNLETSKDLPPKSPFAHPPLNSQLF